MAGRHLAAGWIAVAAACNGITGLDELEFTRDPDPPGGATCDGAPNLSCDVDAGEGCSCADCKTTALCVAGKCTPDGRCTVDDACTCDDCATDPRCGCVADGVCDTFHEGCSCADCADDPRCPG